MYAVVRSNMMLTVTMCTLWSIECRPCVLRFEMINTAVVFVGLRTSAYQKQYSDAK